ncbi:hypothetical protein HYH03_018642, partial [Edaphochlamys debaryana]
KGRGMQCTYLLAECEDPEPEPDYTGPTHRPDMASLAMTDQLSECDSALLDYSEL